MLSAKRLVWLSRLAFTVVFIAVCVLVFGPFGGAESNVGLTDKEAHATAFFTLTILLLLAAPKLRRWDLAWLLAAFGGAIELIQSQIGRDCDFFDWVADCVGIAVVLLPIYVDRLRIKARGQQIRSAGRRRSDRMSKRGRRDSRVYPNGIEIDANGDLVKSSYRDPAVVDDKTHDSQRFFRVRRRP